MILFFKKLIYSFAFSISLSDCLFEFSNFSKLIFNSFILIVNCSELVWAFVISFARSTLLSSASFFSLSFCDVFSFNTSNSSSFLVNNLDFVITPITSIIPTINITITDISLISPPRVLVFISSPLLFLLIFFELISE